MSILAIFKNYILVCAVLGWGIAQLVKFLLVLFFTGKARPERLVGSGGMPSCHTSMVCAMLVSSARQAGVDSPIFALAFILACIVIYDAMGVRRAAGEHAKMINKIVQEDENDEDFDPLNEKIGHTPSEVLGGALLGILVPLVVGLFLK